MGRATHLFLAAVTLMAWPARAEPPAVWLGASGGVSLQSDQYVLGPQGSVRGIGVPFLDLRMRVLAGLGPDYLTLHPALHVALRLEVVDFRVFAVAGGSAYAYRPRGALQTFCSKAELECSGSAAGYDIGFGVGWRAFEADVVMGTGDLPLWTFTMGVGFGL